MPGVWKERFIVRRNFPRNCGNTRSFSNHIPVSSVLEITSSIGLAGDVRERLRPTSPCKAPTRSSRRKFMPIPSRRAVVFCLFAFACLAALPIASAEEDVVHVLSGVVKHVDRGTKKVVVK